MKYCRYCGNEISDADAFCQFCGKSAAPGYTLTVEKPKEFGIKKAVFNIVVDNRETYAIKGGQKLELVLPAGFHTLFVSWNFRLSSDKKTINFILQRNAKFVISLNRVSGGFDVFETQA